MRAERIGESALRRLDEGRPFDEVARQFTTDPESKAAGGDVGTWVSASSAGGPPQGRPACPPRRGGRPVEVRGAGTCSGCRSCSGRASRRSPRSGETIAEELRAPATRQALEAWLDAAARAPTCETL